VYKSIRVTGISHTSGTDVSIEESSGLTDTEGAGAEGCGRAKDDGGDGEFHLGCI
jgi:hypothetical protein